MESIMRLYDIRGIVNKQLNEKIMYLIGLGFANLISQRDDLHSPIAVGRDGRLSSEKYSNKFIQALIDSGIDVINIGLTTTPMMHFSTQFLKTGGSAMITASHNPKEYNGVKINNQIGINLSPKKEAKPLADFYEMYKDNIISLPKPDSTNKGKIIEKNITEDFVSHLIKLVNIEKKLTIVADAGNGVASIPFTPITKELGFIIHSLYMDIDGNFPNHQADPSQENTLSELQKKVVETNSDFGIAFDGDADRAGFVDEKGNIIPADIIGCLIADHTLEKYPGKTIVYELLCTKAIADLIKNKNANGICTKVGRHDLTLEMSKSENNIFGFEKSGHFFYREFFGLDSAMLTFLKVSEILSKSNKPLSNLIKKYQTYAISPIINIHVTNRDLAIEKIKNIFSQYKISTLDGVTVESENFRFTTRKSNSEPLLRTVIEAKKKSELIKIKEQLLESIKEFQN